jgi:hypothetical protein
MSEIPALHVHNTDLELYLRCRRRWRFQSNMEGCLGLEQEGRVSALWLGTGIHHALSIYYHPDTWMTKDLVLAFERWVDEWMGEHAEEVEDWDKEQHDRLAEDRVLGIGMLANYPQWSREADRGLYPVATEQEFSVPLRRPDGTPLVVDIAGLGPRRIVIEGRRDAVVGDDETKSLWLVEDKTYKDFDERKLFNDLQVGTYLWSGLEQYGDRLKGCIYNVLKKRVPVVPSISYAGTPRAQVSYAKETIANTTEALYRAQIERLGHDPRRYAEQLEDLRQRGTSNFWVRVKTDRNPREVREIGDRITVIAIEMCMLLGTDITSPRCYPNPDSIRCPSCAFRDPCEAMSRGDDWRMILEEGYRVRVSTDIAPADAPAVAS